MKQWEGGWIRKTSWQQDTHWAGSEVAAFCMEAAACFTRLAPFVLASSTKDRAAAAVAGSASFAIWEAWEVADATRFRSSVPAPRTGSKLRLNPPPPSVRDFGGLVGEAGVEASPLAPVARLIASDMAPDADLIQF